MTSTTSTEADSALGMLGSAVPEKRISAAKRLGQLGGAKSVGPLMEALRDPDESVQHTAADSLTVIVRTDPSVVPTLIDAVEDKNSGVRGWAVQILGSTGDPSVLPTLVKALNDECCRIPELAAESLVNMGEKAIPALSEVARSGRGTAKELAEGALRKIGAKMGGELLDDRPKPPRLSDSAKAKTRRTR